MKKSETLVLTLLKENARISNEDIADQCGLSVEDVQKIIKKLEKDKVIVGYTTVINENNIDTDEPIRALIEVNVRPVKKEGYNLLAKRIMKYPNVIDHFLISGDYDFLLLVKGKTLHEVASFVSDKLACLDNVTSTKTHFQLKKYKDNGVIVSDQHEGDRLALSL